MSTASFAATTPDPSTPAASRNPTRYWRYALIAAGYLLLHFCLDQLSLRFQTQPGITVWYPPDGLSFGLLLALGPAYAPVCLAAELISNFYTYGLPVPAGPLALWSVFIVACYTGLAALLRGRLRLDLRLRSVRDITLFTLAAGGISLALAAIVIFGFALLRTHALLDYLDPIYDWWVGEAIGLFTITPFVLVVVAPWLRPRSPTEAAELAQLRQRWRSRAGLFTLAGWAVSTALALWLIFRVRAELQLGLAYLVFLPLAWLTLHDGLHGAVMATLAINLPGTLLSLAANDSLTTVAALQLFMLVLALTGLYLGAVVVQRAQAQEAYRTLVDESLQGLLVFQAGHVVFANRVAADTLSIRLDALPALSPTAAVNWAADGDRARVLGYVAALLAGLPAPARFQFQLSHPRGRPRWLEAAGSRLDFRGAPAVQLALLDITDRKLAAAQAEQRVAQLTSLNALGNALSQTLDLDQIYARLSQAILGLLPDSEGLFISLFDPQRAELRCAFAVADEQRYDVANLPPLPLAPLGAGTQSDVVHTRRPVIVNDFQARLSTMRATVELGSGESPRSGLYVPMLANDEVIGVVQTQSRALNRYTSEDADLLALAANTAAVAIQNARLFAEAQRRLAQLQGLHEIDLAIAASLELRPALAVILSQVTRQLNVAATAVHLFNPVSRALEYSGGQGFRGPAIEHTRVPLAGAALARLLADGRVLGPDDFAGPASAFGRAALLAGEGFAAHYAAPLIIKGQLQGILEVFQRAPFAPDREWLDFLAALAAQAAIAVDNAQLFENLQRSHTELAQAYAATLEGWSRALDLRDKETEGHSQRVTDITLRLAAALGLPAEQLVHVRRGALLHDIGKVGVPDSILLKPGPLTDDEWVVMRRHPQFAYNMLAPIDYLQPALDIPYSHHEWWDGTGYPLSLAAEHIPLAARIFAVVDVWDALTSDRPYRPAWTADRVRAHLQSRSGSHFDPHIVAVALESGLLGYPLKNLP